MSDAPTMQDDDGEVLEEAFLLYQDAGLRLPPVPRELAADLEQLGEWYFATGEANPDDRDSFLAAAMDPNAAPEVAFGHLGHGVASWYLCYRLVLAPLAVFVRQHFGAVTDEDDTEELSYVNSTAAMLEEVVVLAEAARARGTLKPDQRLIVVVDERDGDFWQVSPGGAVNTSEHVLAEAMAFLERT